MVYLSSLCDVVNYKLFVIPPKVSYSGLWRVCSIIISKKVESPIWLTKQNDETRREFIFRSPCCTLTAKSTREVWEFQTTTQDYVRSEGSSVVDDPGQC